jgi:hypothetical protein
MIHGTRTRSAMSALSAALLAGAMLAASAGVGIAANTRNVYFGAPPDVCPTTVYPSGCGGGIDANGNATYGTEVYSPEQVSTTTTTTSGKLVGYRLQIQNQSGSTLTHVVVLGGALAGLTTNQIFPPPVGTSLPSFTASDGSVQGFSYYAVYVNDGPVPDCRISTSTSPTARTNDSLRCDFGNVSANQDPTTLTIVMQAPSTLPSDPWTVQPWNELQLNEGSSSSGANVDSFYAVGAPGGLKATATTTDYAETFVLPAGGLLTTNDEFVATASDPTATRATLRTTPDGNDSRIDETGAPSDTLEDCATLDGKSLTCFGQTSVVSVVQPVNLTVTGIPPAQDFAVVDPNDPTKWAVPPLQLDFRWDKTEIPGGVNWKNIQIVHDGVVVTDACLLDSSGVPTTASPMPCRLPTTRYSDKDLGITVFTPTNGNWRPS